MWKFTGMRRQSVLVALGDRARDKGDWDAAVGLYSSALARGLRNASLWVQYGHALKESGKLQDRTKLARAEAAYRRAMIYAPRAGDIHLQLGHVLKLLGRIDEAKAAYLRALALDPALATARDELRQGRTDGAKAAYVRALALDPALAPVRGELRALGWDEDDGVALHAALTSLDGIVPPRWRLPLIEQADAARDAARWMPAARGYRTILQRDPGNAPIWVQYGHALKEAGNLKDPALLAEAEAAYRYAIALKPSLADSHLQLGHVLKLQGKNDEAEAAYIRAFVLGLSISAEELQGFGWTAAAMTELRLTALHYQSTSEKSIGEDATPLQDVDVSILTPVHDKIELLPARIPQYPRFAPRGSIDY